MRCFYSWATITNHVITHCNLSSELLYCCILVVMVCVFEGHTLSTRLDGEVEHGGAVMFVMAPGSKPFTVLLCSRNMRLWLKPCTMQAYANYSYYC